MEPVRNPSRSQNTSEPANSANSLSDALPEDIRFRVLNMPLATRDISKSESQALMSAFRFTEESHYLLEVLAKRGGLFRDGATAEDRMSFSNVCQQVIADIGTRFQRFENERENLVNAGAPSEILAPLQELSVKLKRLPSYLEELKTSLNEGEKTPEQLNGIEGRIREVLDTIKKTGACAAETYLKTLPKIEMLITQLQVQYQNDREIQPYLSRLSTRIGEDGRISFPEVDFNTERKKLNVDLQPTSAQNILNLFKAVDALADGGLTTDQRARELADPQVIWSGEVVFGRKFASPAEYFNWLESGFRQLAHHLKSETEKLAGGDQTESGKQWTEHLRHAATALERGLSYLDERKAALHLTERKLDVHQWQALMNEVAILTWNMHDKLQGELVAGLGECGVEACSPHAPSYEIDHKLPAQYDFTRNLSDNVPRTVNADAQVNVIAKRLAHGLTHRDMDYEREFRLRTNE